MLQPKREVGPESSFLLVYQMIVGDSAIIRCNQVLSRPRPQEEGSPWRLFSRGTSFLQVRIYAHSFF